MSQAYGVKPTDYKNKNLIYPVYPDAPPFPRSAATPTSQRAPLHSRHASDFRARCCTCCFDMGLLCRI